MDADQTTRLDEQCAKLLADYDEALAQGDPPKRLSSVEMPSELQPRLQRALDCLARLERAWPRAPQTGDASQRSDAIPGYEILGELGRGGMGVVYKARQLSLKRLVALKMVLAGRRERMSDLLRFRVEAESIARLQHPHIVQIYEVGIYQGRPFLALELVEGASLDQRIAGRPQPPRQAAEWTETLARAVAHAHQRGVLHRDLKPANILVCDDGTVKIGDFGLAKPLPGAAGQTHDGDVLGTPSYMAPEQASGHAETLGESVDIYALGAIFYELLVGRPPFSGATPLATIEQVRSHEPVPPRRLQPTVPRDLQTICLKCLRKEPNKRYASAQALADDLQRALTGQTIAARPAGFAERAWRWCRRKPALAALIAVVVSTLLAVASGGPLAALWMRAQRDFARTHERKAVAAERERTEQLRAAYLAQARAGRNSGQIGRRFNGLDVLAKAAAIRPAADLRGEMVACLYFADLQLQSVLPNDSVEQRNLTFDLRLERLARSDARGTIVVSRIAGAANAVSLEGDGDPAWLLRFSPDGRWLAATHHPRDREDLRHTRLWDTNDPAAAPKGLPGGAIAFYPRRARLAGGESIGPVAIEQVAIGAPDGRVELHDLTGDAAPALICQTVSPHSLAFDPSGRLLAVSTLTQAEVRVHDLTTGAVLVLAQPASARGLAWSDDGERLATAGDNGRVRIWFVGSWDGLAERSWRQFDWLDMAATHQSAVINLTFSHSGDLLVSTSWDDTLRLWDTHDGRLLATTPGFAGDPRFAPDDTRLAACQTRSKAAVYRVASRLECREFAFPTQADGPWRSCETSDDGRLLAVVHDRALCLYDLATFRRLGRAVHRCQCVAFDPDGAHLLSAGQDGLARWPIDIDGHSLRSPAMLKTTTDIQRLYACRDLSKLGARLIGGALAVVRGDGLSELTRMMDDSSGSAIGQVRDNAVRLSPDGAWLAAGTWHGDGTAIWETRTGKLVKRLLPGDACPSFSPDGRWLVDGGETAYQFWRTATWEKSSRSIRRDAASVPGPSAFSPDGKLLAIARTPRELCLVDPATGELLCACPAADARPIVDLRFSADGRRLIVLRETGLLQIWDVALIRRHLQTAGIDWP